MRKNQNYDPWIWKNLGTPGKGAAIRLAAMLPFVPGMLGSRKKGSELRDIYSGCRSRARTRRPLVGGRINAFRRRADQVMAPPLEHSPQEPC